MGDDDQRACKVARLEAMRSKALALGGPLGHLLTRSFDLMTNVVRSGEKDRETLEYTLESFANERAFAEKRDEQRDSDMHHVLYGLTEGLQMMGEAILEERKEEEERIEAAQREAKAQASVETWRNEASPDYNLGRDEPLNISLSTRSSSTAITQEEQPVSHQTIGGSGTPSTVSCGQGEPTEQSAPIRSLLDYYNDDCVTLDDSDDDDETTAPAVAADAAAAAPPMPAASAPAAAPPPAAPAELSAFAKTEPEHEPTTIEEEDEDPGEIIVLEESVQCKLCDLWVKDQAIFKEHVKETHKDVTLCDICGEVLTAGVVFDEHMKDVHEDAVQCDLCGSYVADREVFVQHLMEVHNIDPFADDEDVGQAAQGQDAAAAATQQASTSAAPAAPGGDGEGENKGKKRKSRRHEDDTDFDGEGIRIKKKKKIEPAPRSRRSCTLGLSFKEPEDMEVRAEDFLDGQTHKCPECPVTQNDLSKLRRHMREVHGIMPYECGTCEAKFAKRKELNAHLKQENHQEHRAPEKEKKGEETEKTGDKVEERKTDDNRVEKGTEGGNVEQDNNSIGEKAADVSAAN